MKKNLTVTLLTASLLFGFVSCGNNSSTKYTITFDGNGGTVSETTIQVEAGKTANLPTPEKENKSFLGWFTGWGSEDVQYTNKTAIEKDVTLIAKWNEYDVSFMSDTDSLFALTTILPGQKVTAPAGEPGKPADAEYCYNFDKWNFNFDTPINSNTTINALYNKEAITYTTFKVPSFFNDHQYDVSFVYKDTLFDIPSTKFDRSLASFGLGLAACPTANVDNYLTSLGFNGIVHNNNFSEEKDGYTFAHKAFGDQDVIIVINKGFKYGTNWADNLDIGLEGPHHGFYVQALNVYENLQNYLQTYQETPYKVLMVGYSRAAAITDLLAREVMINNKVSQDNLYVYTYEAPKSIPAAMIEGIDFSNVFNIINGADIIPLVLPTQYQECTRIGVDIDIYRDNIDELVRGLDPDINFGTFSPTSDYATEPELANYIINSLAAYESESYPTIRTREEFVNNYQDMFVYLLRLFLSLKEETINAIKTDIQEKGMYYILTLLSTKDGVFNYLNPFIQADGIEYSEDELKTNCSLAVTFVTGGPGLVIISKYTVLTRVIAMHSFEVNYLLLKQY